MSHHAGRHSRAASSRPGRHGVISDVVWALTSGLGGFGSASGIVDANLGSSTFGVPGWLQLLAGVLLILAGAVAVGAGRLADPRDHRAGAGRLRHYAAVAAGVFGVTVVVLVGMEIILR